MAEETVESLELEIRARATSAAETITSLATSVSDFGRDVQQYIGNLSNLADVLKNIAESAKALNGVKNIKSVISNAAVAAGKAKAVTIGKAFQPIVPPVRSSETVKGKTTVVRDTSGKTFRYDQSADAAAKALNNRYNYGSNASLSREIQGIRNKMLQGATEAAMKDLERLASDISQSAKSKGNSQLASAFDRYYGKSVLRLSKADTQEVIGSFGGIKNANDALWRAGVRAQLRGSDLEKGASIDQLWENRSTISGDIDMTPKFGDDAANDLRAALDGLKMKGVSQLSEVISAVTNAGDVRHQTWLRDHDLHSDEEALATDVMPTLLKAVLGSSAIDPQKVAGDVGTKVAESVKAQVQSAVESMGGRQFFDLFNQRLGIGGKPMSAKESASVFEKQLADDETITEEATKFAEAIKYSSQRITEELRSATADIDSGAGPRVGNHRSFDDYSGPDHRADSALASEEFERRLDEITSGDDFLKNLRTNMKRLKEAGIGNTAEIFAELKAKNDAFHAREEEARRIQEARDAQQELTNSASMTTEQFMQENEQTDILQMKLDGVKQKLDEALNADNYDPAKIARLADQYQKLSDKIREVGFASKDSGSMVGGFHGVMSALGQTIQKGHVGKLATQFWRIAKMRAIRAIIKGVSSALKEGIGNLYQWSKAMNGAFAGALDTIASKSMFAKNSIATAFAPAIQALVPLISTVVGWIHTASNAIAQFFAILNGQTTWTKAIETVEEWGAATKKATGGAAKDVKDLLADWDELNIIQSETGNGGGSGSGKKTPDYGAMFEETSVFDEWTSKFKTIKGIVDAIGLGIGAWFVMSGIEHFLERLGVAGDKVSSVFSRIRKGIVGVVLLKVGFELAEDVGETIAENGFTWQNVLEGIGSIVAAGLGGKFVANAVGLSGFAGSILGISIAVGIGLNAYINKQRQLTYEKMAKDSFASAGKKGFNVEEYKTAIEKELNKRIGKLSVTVEAFNTYGPAAEQLNTATKALSNLSEYVFGGKKLTAEQANEFRNNWNIVFESINTMHNATWSTLNLGIADAMKGESEEARKYLAELQKDMIEVQRLTGGAQAAWRTEMTQISGRIASNTASKEDLQRYEVLLELIAGSDSEISSSLSSMKEWNETVSGFDFGDGAEAVENALGFISDMDSTYSSATEEVEAWGDAQKKAISAVKRALEEYHNVGLISDEDYDESLKTFDKWDAKYKEKVAKDLAEVERLKSETYGKIFEQVLRGFYINDANGGSVDEYLKSVQPVIEELEKVWTLPKEWYEDDTVTYQLGDFNFTDFWTHLFGQETNSSFGAKIANPILSRMMGEEDFNKFIRSLYGGNEPFGEIRYEVTPTALPEDAFDTKEKEPETVYFDSDKWEFVDGGYVPKMGTPEPVVVTVETELPDGLNYGEDGSYALAVKDASLTVHIGTETDGNIQYNDDGSWEWTPEKQETVTLDAKGWEHVDGKWVRTDTETTQKPIDESPVEVLGIPTDGGWLKNFWDRLTYVEEMDVPGTSGSSSSGRTGWFTGVPNEQITVDATASGMATDDNINNLTASTEQGMNSIEGVLTLMRTAMANIENYARQTAAKDLTVVISPTSALGRTTGRATEQYERISGDFMGG